MFLTIVLKLLELIFFPLVSAASTAAEFASCLAGCVHSAASCFDFSSSTMQTAVLHAPVVICNVSSHFVMSICSQPQETSIKSRKKGKVFRTAGICREESYFSCIAFSGASRFQEMANFCCQRSIHLYRISHEGMMMGEGGDGSQGQNRWDRGKLPWLQNKIHQS